jgi:hypothetical protein
MYRPGCLVRLCRIISDGMWMHEEYNGQPVYGALRFHGDDVGIVLHVKTFMGQPNICVITSRGVIGWVETNYLRVVE